MVAALGQLQEMVLTSQHCKERFVSAFVVSCQCKAAYEKTEPVCPVAIACSEDLSLSWGSQRRWKTRESCVNAPSEEGRGGWGSMMPA